MADGVFSGEPPVLAGRGVEVTYPTAAGAVRALRGVDVEVARGAVTVLAGPSGSGKSTLLRVLALVERPTAGDVSFAGRSLRGAPWRRLRELRRGRVVLVLQDPVANLLAHLDVAGNLRAAAALAHRRDVDPTVLDRLGLAGTAALPVRALSGGQQQRLAFATALVAGAEVLLADEPTSQLDEASAARVVTALRDVAAAGSAVVVASHDPAVVAAGDAVVRLADGERAG